ncbi:hypothetical protein [Bradyrhizobium tunisiense]
MHPVLLKQRYQVVDHPLFLKRPIAAFHPLQHSSAGFATKQGEGPSPK